MIKLFIDDIREPTTDGWIILRSAEEVFAWFDENGCPDYISFDHDLGDSNSLTGYDIAKWMVNTDLDHNGEWISKDFQYNIHSANPVGAMNIKQILTLYLRMKNES